MKTQSHPLFARAVCPMAALITTLTFGSSGNAAAQIRKEDNIDTLNLPSSWVGGTAPSAGDIAQWDNQLTFANTSDLGGPMSLLGLRVLNPTGAVAITSTAPNILTLGTSGIDMSAATQNLTMAGPLALGSAQPWSVASGRFLTISSIGVGAVSGTGPLTVRGPGGVRLGGLAATYTFTGGMTVTAGNGIGNVAGTPGGSSLISAANLVFDLAAIAPSNTTGLTLSNPALTASAGATVHTIGGARSSGSSTPAWVQSSSLTVQAGNVNFTQSRGSSARTINQFSAVTRAVGGTVNFRDPINSDGTNNVNTGGYRTPNTATVQINGIVPYITYTRSTAGSSTATAGTSFFASAGTSLSGANYASYTSSISSSLGTDTQNSTVVTDVALVGAATVNSVRFNDTTARTVTIDVDPAAPLIIGTGAILVTNNGTANHTITGGKLMGGNPGSGSGYDLIIHQMNNTSSLIINSEVADNTVAAMVTPTALTKTGAGKLVIGGVATYTGATYVNAGTLLVNGALSGSSSTQVFRSGTLGGSGTINGPVAVDGTLAPGAGIGTLATGALTFGSRSTLAIEINTATSTADKVVVTGGIASSGNAVNLVLSDLGYDLGLPNGTKFTLVDYTTTWSGTDYLVYGGSTIANNSTITLGANTFIVNYADVAVDGTALTLTVTGAAPSTPFLTWMNTFAAQLPNSTLRTTTADPDNDGRNNALEFALDGNPASATDSGKMSISTDDSNDVGIDRDLTLTIAVRDGAILGAGPNGSSTLTVDGLVYTIQASLDLVTWDKPVNEVTPAFTLSPAPNVGWTARTFQVTDSNGLPDKRFIRANVSY